MDCQPVHSNLMRRLKRDSVTRIHNIRLSNETETLLGRLKEHLKGTAETDKPSTSVVVRRACYCQRWWLIKPTVSGEGELTRINKHMKGKTKRRNRQLDAPQTLSLLSIVHVN